ncbi:MULTISPECIES: efflux RND transporter permease subunit [unclassified Ectothiorhodospira]|uniref:efflux RND transporter permease subunit n=1 Tax=unclassified Ectothiorhodospira TaxID=2684909 RepID=UPI001EE88057|nr:MULTISPECIES: efflux RND transporter permease subunit [unclassified Ectothiorhodospira]MCG5516864.1 efflux RND transporter permease subunit [Ectothiorhodospira sp. 9100]MCG5520053.1 efflux RND transporter permease subunit [Ectothiorhodospira sp. 9905]
MTRSRGVIGFFLSHPVAANLLVVLMLLSGSWALLKLNTQFFPTFALDFVTVQVAWTGASAEDVQQGITIPLEQELRTVDGLRNLTSTSSLGVASISLEFESGTDMTLATDQVKDRVAQQRNLPEAAETPVVTRVIRYEPIARLLITGPDDLRELRPLVRDLERQLLDAGIARIEFTGLPEEQMAIQVPTAQMLDLGMSLNQIGERVDDLSQDLPAGMVGRDDTARQLRSLDQGREAMDFAQLPLRSEAEGGLILLGDVAEIERRPRDNQTFVRYQGQPAVELALQRTENDDALEASGLLLDWLDSVEHTLPPDVEIHIYDQFYEPLVERIGLLLKNGAGGLLLVLGILFLFLNGRLALRVALSIPVSFTAAFLALWALGGSINMISLFGFIMSLGIIVDNAIVVSEHAYTQYQRGMKSAEAAEHGARRMLAPVISASLTTVAAFLPLMLIGGIIGNILFDIPLVVICVILATLLISFLVLPFHLKNSLEKVQPPRPGSLRAGFDRRFEDFRQGPFRRVVTGSVNNAGLTLASGVAVLILAVGLLAGGRLGFTFFPSPEGTVINASAHFVAGTPPQRVDGFLNHMEEELYAAEEALGGDLVRNVVVRAGQGVGGGGGEQAPSGDQFGSIIVELVSPDQRQVRNTQFIQEWQSRVREPAGMELFSITERQSGPPGRDVDVRLTGDDPEQVKAAGLDLAETLNDFPGVFAVEDNMPFGREQLIYRLTPEGLSLGLTTESLGQQLRAAFDGHLAQIYQEGLEEIEVRVLLPDDERHHTVTLDRFAVILPDGGMAPLDTVADLRPRQGFETLRRAETRLAIAVSAEVDRSVNNAGRIREQLADEVLPELTQRYAVEWSFEGRAADQAETLGDMRTGLIFALALIYLTLAWVFGSYGWPLVVMAIIPFGLLGALVGHWVLGMELTILSLFGLFGLTGIVVNNSIILVSFYQSLRGEGLAQDEAIIEASCQRLRAVVLTSFTTIAGLMPLLFERSVQAQFLIPMAVSIVFGLAFATVLVLVLIPALLAIHERLAGWWGQAQTA